MENRPLEHEAPCVGRANSYSLTKKDTLCFTKQNFHYYYNQMRAFHTKPSLLLVRYAL
jgi:hypothetical protein